MSRFYTPFVTTNYNKLTTACWAKKHELEWNCKITPILMSNMNTADTFGSFAGEADETTICIVRTVNSVVNTSISVGKAKRKFVGFALYIKSSCFGGMQNWTVGVRVKRTYKKFRYPLNANKLHKFSISLFNCKLDLLISSPVAKRKSSITALVALY